MNKIKLEYYLEAEFMEKYIGIFNMFFVFLNVS